MLHPEIQAIIERYFLPTPALATTAMRLASLPLPAEKYLKAVPFRFALDINYSPCDFTMP